MIVVRLSRYRSDFTFENCALPLPLSLTWVWNYVAFGVDTERRRATAFGSLAGYDERR